MPGYIACPQCQARMYDDGSLAGRHVACPRCGAQFLMPTAAAPVAGPAPAAAYEPGATLPDRAARIHRSSRGTWFNVLAALGILTLLSCGGVGAVVALIAQQWRIANEELEHEARVAAGPMVSEHMGLLLEAGFDGGRFEANKVTFTYVPYVLEPELPSGDEDPPDDAADSDTAPADGSPPDTPPAAPAAAQQVHIGQVASVRFEGPKGQCFVVVMARDALTDPWQFEHFEFPEGTPKPLNPQE